MTHPAERSSKPASLHPITGRRCRMMFGRVPVLLLGCSILGIEWSPMGTVSAFGLPRTWVQPSSESAMDDITMQVGDSALKQVQWLSTRATAKQNNYYAKDRVEAFLNRTALVNNKVDGTGGPVYYAQKKQLLELNRPTIPGDKQVWDALASLEQDMELLDLLAGQKPQLSVLELTLLMGAVLSAAAGPMLLGGQITEFLAPAAAAFTAAIGIGAEYTGKVAVADAKEIAAASLQCAAEAEGFLAQAERAKAITPLCVGVGATAATLALLVPVLLDSLGVGNNLQLVTEVYLLCPLVAILAAAVAGLAYQETRSLSRTAIGIGNRRFAQSGLVGRSWLSVSEQIGRKSSTAASKWKTFCLSVLPAPILGALVPGALPTKTIVVAALAAAESAYFLARAEDQLSRAMDAVALKSRSAAVCDTYANQGARSAAILPFTSALSALCAALTAAVVELPFLESLAAASTLSSAILEIVIVAAFPLLSALLAAAASVSKARCEVDAEAAMQAATTLALQYGDPADDPVLRPLSGVRELIRLAVSSSLRRPIRMLVYGMSSVYVQLKFFWRRIRRRTDFYRPTAHDNVRKITAPS